MSPKTTISCAEFERLAGTLGPAELVDGEIVEMSPGGYTHSLVTGNIYSVLHEFARKNHLGRVLTNELGIHVQQSPPRSRGADVAFISFETLPPGEAPTGFLTFPPDLIVEVLGDDDTLSKLEDKVEDYHRFGVRMVWIADPRTRSVTLFPLGEPARTLQEGDCISAGANLRGVLPGLSLAVESLFEVV